MPVTAFSDRGLPLVRAGPNVLPQDDYRSYRDAG